MHTEYRPLTLSIASLLLAISFATPAHAADVSPRPQTATEKKAIDYLLSQQGPDGSWVPQAGPAVTALILKGLLQAGHTMDEPALQKALAFIDKSHKPDGGWYDNAQATYNTAITLSTVSILPEATRARYRDQIVAAQRFLKSIQAGGGIEAALIDDKGKAIDKEHPWFGGWGYHQGKGLQAGTRPDNSNSQFVIAALRDSGLPASDPAIQNYLVFLQRTQAYEGNSAPWAKGRDDGGFIYSMRWNEKHQFYGESEGPDAKDRDGNEILTAYGSMTYAGLKSLLYAEVAKDDPRVKAAIRWITGNYTLDLNPGLNNAQGLYYYYHTFAAALRAYGQEILPDAKGVKHDWRKDLEEKLASVQKPDGSFINTADRWMESNPVLVTSYVVLALQNARK
jgi:squalene-hopene/tetraprenyl-beta-curcumene cyclase